jgi:prevent-host-death family protein
MAVENVGIRELRQNLSVYLRRVARGDEFIVTERGEPVARLTGPEGTAESWLERVRREGKVRKFDTSVFDAKPPPGYEPDKRDILEILDEMREDRF